jgi:tRNA modification GTPase
MINKKADAIVACCTARGVGAVALVRVSGDGAFEVVDRVAHLSGGVRFADLATHTIHYGQIRHPEDGRMLDEVLFLVMRAPRTFTGHDTIEITCHGNPWIVQHIIDACILAGARQAERGEFTRQALENNKIDIVQAEAIHELIVAQSEQSVALALRQVRGALSSYVHEVEQQIVRLLAVVEASFEFVEEEQADLAYAGLVAKEYSVLLEQLSRLMVDLDRQRHVRQGFRVSCIGSVNAGKSTLFNALIGRNRSIVSDVAGTTRDVVDATITCFGSMLTIVDTAGIRSSGDVVEKIGIERSHEEAVLADIILLVVDVSRPINQFEWGLYVDLASVHAHKTILIKHKIDAVVVGSVIEKLDSLKISTVVEASGLSGFGIDSIMAALERKIQQLSESSTPPFMLNERHAGIIKSVHQLIVAVEPFLWPQPKYELAAMYLRDGLQNFVHMTGRNVTETVLDQVFISFCIGK